MDFVERWLLTLIAATPIAVGTLLLATGALANLLLGAKGFPNRVWKWFGILGSLVTFGLSAFLWAEFDPEATGYQFVQHIPWLPRFGIHWFVGVDGISLLLVLLTTFLVPLALIASYNEIARSTKAFVFFVLASESALLGAFFSLNLFQFYVFWEVTLVPMVFLIGIWGGERRIAAAVKFFVFTLAGSLFMLMGMLVLVHLNAEQGGLLNFDLVGAPGGRGLPLLETTVGTDASLPWWQQQRVLFGLFALAFAVKIPLFPLHTWLPDAHVEAPTTGSVLLAGVLLKLGVYGFIRILLPLLPVAAAQSAGWIFGLAVLGIVYGSLVALVQRDLKKLVAYTSVAHLGFVMLGVFTLNDQGLAGAVLQMVNHGVSTAALFLCVGFLHERRGTHEIAEFGGVARTMPMLGALFGVAVLSSIAVPGSNGFVGEFLILLGAFDANWKMALAATSGVVLAACTMLWMFRRVMLGPIESPQNRGLMDLDWRERGVLVALVVPILVVGMHPNPILRRIEPSVIATLEEVQRRTRGRRARAGDGAERRARASRRRRNAKSGSALRWRRSSRRSSPRSCSPRSVRSSCCSARSRPAATVPVADTCSSRASRPPHWLSRPTRHRQPSRTVRMPPSMRDIRCCASTRCRPTCRRWSRSHPCSPSGSRSCT